MAPLPRRPTSGHSQERTERAGHDLPMLKRASEVETGQSHRVPGRVAHVPGQRHEPHLGHRVLPKRVEIDVHRKRAAEVQPHGTTRKQREKVSETRIVRLQRPGQCEEAAEPCLIAALRPRTDNGVLERQLHVDWLTHRTTKHTRKPVPRHRSSSAGSVFYAEPVDPTPTAKRRWVITSKQSMPEGRYPRVIQVFMLSIG